MTIGKRIKELRESLGISQVALADAISEKKQTIYKYENNIVTNIPIDKIEAISKALKTTPSYIMGWSEQIVSEIDNALYDQKEKPTPVSESELRPDQQALYNFIMGLDSNDTQKASRILLEVFEKEIN